ncbi:MAG: hypothetical protein RLZZ528_1848 [Pseudomonadota bacterium]
MNETSRIAKAALAQVTWPLRLTRAGMVAERITRGFWPVWTLVFALMAGFAFGLQDWLPLEALWIGSVLGVLALVWLLLAGIRGFRWPTQDEARARLDARLPGRPIATLTDRQVLGGEDPASQAVWQVHLQRLAERLRGIRPVEPDLRVAARDPYALRYVAFGGLVLALLFGSLGRVGEVASIAGGNPATGAAAGPAWEGWAEPPSYTGKPSLYLNDITAGTLDLPEGSRITFRIYGPAGSVEVAQTLADPLPAPADTPDPAAASVQVVEFEALRSGTISVSGEGGRDWAVTVLPDAAPTVLLEGEMGRDADGLMSQGFAASDDHGVTGGQARFTLDMAALDRRYGLAAEPEAVEPLVFDLPLPITGDRREFAETLAEDASKHVWANLPVQLVLEVADARGQTGQTDATALILPGRRFFDPIAAAVVEMRRDLLWTRANAPRVAQVLHAMTHRPEGMFTNERAYLMMRVAMRRLDGALAQGPISKPLRDEMAEDLWQIALLIEDGGLDDALARMQQAQERLSEAIRNGASPEEIQKLMDELRQATDDYIRMLAENMERQGADEPSQQAQNEGQQITGDQIQEMMDEIQRLMEEGRMAEAQELLDQLSRMLENLRVTEGQGGEGQQGQGSQAMRNLQDTLRDQQGLSDDSFSELQEQFDPNGLNQRNQRPGQQRGTPQGQDGEGQEGEGQGGDETPESLAERQRALREELQRQAQDGLPGEGTPEGEATRDALEGAGRAMTEAERRLREGDLPGAIDRQAEAIEALRDGLRNMGEAMAAENPNRQPGTQGEAVGDASRQLPRDPLGRSTGQNGRVGTDENMLQGDDIYRRARDLLDEIRRRSGEQDRPSVERDYLRRLLDQF